MSNVLRALTLVFTLSFLTLGFAASDAANGMETMVNSYTQEFMAELQDSVDLTPEQQDAMEEIMHQGIGEREDIIQSYQGQKGIRVKKQMRNELNAANATTRSEVQNVLTDEQYQAFLEVQEKNQAKVRERINRDF